MAWLHDLGEQLPVCGKDCAFEIVAVDSVPADALHASVLFAVIQQKAVAIHIIAAKFFDECIDLLRLFWGNLDNHHFHLLYGFLLGEILFSGCCEKNPSLVSTGEHLLETLNRKNLSFHLLGMGEAV